MKNTNPTVPPPSTPAPSFVETPEFEAALKTLCGTIRALREANPLPPVMEEARNDLYFNELLNTLLIATERAAKAGEIGKKARKAFVAREDARKLLYAHLDAMQADAAEMGFEAGRKAPAATAPDAQVAPAAPIDVHDWINRQMQAADYDNLFTECIEAAGRLDRFAVRSVKSPQDEETPEFKAREAAYHAARKVLRAAVAQFGTKAFLAGTEAAK